LINKYIIKHGCIEFQACSFLCCNFFFLPVLMSLSLDKQFFPKKQQKGQLLCSFNNNSKYYILSFSFSLFLLFLFLPFLSFVSPLHLSFLALMLIFFLSLIYFPLFCFSYASLFSYSFASLFSFSSFSLISFPSFFVSASFSCGSRCNLLQKLLFVIERYKTLPHSYL